MLDKIIPEKIIYLSRLIRLDKPIGFLLLIPFTRNIIFKIALKKQKIIKEEKEENKIIDGEIVDKKKDEL